MVQIVDISNALSFTILVNQTAFHAISEILRSVSSALLKSATGNMDATISVTNYPLPTLSHEVTIEVSRESGELQDEARLESLNSVQIFARLDSLNSAQVFASPKTSSKPVFNSLNFRTIVLAWGMQGNVLAGRHSKPLIEQPVSLCFWAICNVVMFHWHMLLSIQWKEGVENIESVRALAVYD